MQEMDGRMIQGSLGYRERTENEDELFVILREPLQGAAGDTIVMRAREGAKQTESEKEDAPHY
jgi:hypothetical protein